MQLAFPGQVRTGKRKFALLEEKYFHQKNSKNKVIKAVKARLSPAPEKRIKNKK